MKTLRISRPRLGSSDDRERSTDKHKKSAGQVLVLFALTSVMIIGMVAIVIDVAWFWANEQSMQKAADAGALAGAVYLPGNVSQAYTSAIAEAKKNGYVSGTNGVVVTPAQDVTNKRRLKVTISGPVQAYFAQVFCALTTCTKQISETVSGTAEFTLPVPMGSPQNYYGVGTYVYNTVNTNTNNNNNNTGWLPEGGTVAGGTWTNANQRGHPEQRLHHRKRQQCSATVEHLCPADRRGRRAQRPDPRHRRPGGRAEPRLHRRFRHVHQLLRQDRGELERWYDMVDGPEHERA